MRILGDVCIWIDLCETDKLWINRINFLIARERPRDVSPQIALTRLRYVSRCGSTSSGTKATRVSHSLPSFFTRTLAAYIMFTSIQTLFWQHYSPSIPVDVRYNQCFTRNEWLSHNSVASTSTDIVRLIYTPMLKWFVFQSSLLSLFQFTFTLYKFFWYFNEKIVPRVQSSRKSLWRLLK